MGQTRRGDGNACGDEAFTFLDYFLNKNQKNIRFWSNSKNNFTKSQKIKNAREIVFYTVH